MKKTHTIIKDGASHTVKHEFMKDYKDSIPLEIAIIESGFPPEDWKELYRKDKVLTKLEYNLAIKKIVRERKSNYKLLAN